MSIDEKKLPLQADNSHPDSPYFRIYRNDQYEHHCVEFDVLGCWLERYVTDDLGYLMFDDDGCYIKQRVYGSIRVEWRNSGNDDRFDIDGGRDMYPFPPLIWKSGP